jgi:hypothetical protein
MEYSRSRMAYSPVCRWVSRAWMLVSVLMLMWPGGLGVSSIGGNGHCARCGNCVGKM